MKNYKDTLLIFDSPIEMRGNLSQKDIVFKDYWNKINLYDLLSSRNAEEFYLHDGPPYANGKIHMGHALNKILKDILVRYNSLKGLKINWEFGWDTHGLPIELILQKKHKNILTKKSISEYLLECKNFALSQVEIQRDQFSKLNLLTNLEKNYLTLNKKYESNEIDLFFKLLNKGIIFQDFKPIHWSWSSRTALADAEIEYKDLETDSIYFSFQLEKNKDINFLIWTTTPWTLPTNVAVAFSKKMTYSIVKINNLKYIISKKLIGKLEQEFNLKIEYIEDIKIENFINEYSINPLNGNKSKIIYGDHVNDESGTGAVHISGGHGLDDYFLCKKHNLKIIVGVNERGIQINSGKYNDEFYLKNNVSIINDLKGKKFLVHHHKIIHSASIDWRTKKEILYRATKQWFISIDDHKEMIKESIDDVSFFPKWGKQKLGEMIENRKDWCISRQRIWGLPIPIIYDEKNLPIKSIDLQNKISKIFREEGSITWWTKDVKYFLPPSIKYVEGFRKEKDILDIWFDSGSSFLNNKDKVSDAYLEGNDQYRGWFNSSLINSYFFNGRAPFKKIISHGFVVDGKGLKMSKSVGNVVDPELILKKYGSDVLKLWVANSDFTDSIRISDEILNQVAKQYKKIRNTIRFLLANLVDYDGEEPKGNNFTNSVVSNLSISNKEIEEAFNKFNLKKVVTIILNQINSGAISYFLEYSKDVLYVKGKNSSDRKLVQYCLDLFRKFLFKSLAPIIPVTVEESFLAMDESKKSFFFKPETLNINHMENSNWENFNILRNNINVKIEKLREKGIIKRSQEAMIEIDFSNEFKDFLDLENINEILMVAEVKSKSISKGLKVRVKKFDGEKCERCWKYFSKSKMLDDICFTCSEVLKKD